MGIIVNFANYKKRQENVLKKKLINCPYDVNEFISLSDYIFDHSNLLLSLQTSSPKFKFPTTMSDFKRTHNPILVLFQRFNEVVMTYDKNNHIHTWTIELFKDSDFVNSILVALDNDISLLTDFFTKYNETSANKKQEFIKLVKMLNDFETFEYLLTNLDNIKYF